jgi:TonB-dependent receptor
MRKLLCFLLFVSSYYVLSLGSAAAQTGRGIVSGTVKDQANATLGSALVELQPLGRKAVSDDQGQFRITDVPAGEYTLNASYLGFAPFTGTVKVEAGQTVNVDPILKVASQADEVLVTAERVQGEAEAINIERLSDNIVQVLPERVINSLPNTNIADAVGRLPSVSLERDEGEGKYVQIRGTEPRLTNVTINGVNVPSVEGNVRNIKLDSVPADLVERIEVFKTLSADQDADGIGGTVNLVTRTAGEKATYSFGGTTGYNPLQNGFWRGGFNGVAGKRFGVNKKFGLLFNGTFDQTNRGIDDMEPAETVGTNPATGNNIAYTNTVDYRTYNYYRTRYGFSLGADYVLKPGSNIYVKALDSDFHDFGETWVYTPTAGTNIKAVNGNTVTFLNAQDCQPVNQAFDSANLAQILSGAVSANPCSPGNYVYRHYIRRPDQAILSVLVGARHDFGANLLTYEVAGSRSHNIGGQDFPTTNFAAPSASYAAPGDSTGLTPGTLLAGPTPGDTAVDITNRLRPKFIAQDGSNLYDPTQYSVTKTIFPIYHATQVNYQGAASWSRRYSVSSHPSVFEIGLKIRDSHSTQNQDDTNYKATGSNPFTLSSVLGTYTNNSYYEHSFAVNGLAYGPMSSYGKITQAILGSLGSTFTPDVATSLRRSLTAFYDADERIYAGYLQDAITLGKFRIQAGVRFDAASENFTTNNFDATTDPANPIVSPNHQSSSYFNALPSVQVQYQLQANTNLRANYSQGISRPNIGDLVPVTIVDPNTSPRGTVQLGNPNLKPTKANNYDLLIEHYFQPLGILQAGFFYKDLSNPIYATSLIIQAGQPNAGFFQNQSINGPNAHIAGFEAAWEQRFSFLPGLLNGFGVAANYSYTSSQATFPVGFNGSRIDHPSLQRQAPNNWNAGLTYDKWRFSMRFAVSHNDASIFQYAYAHVDAPTDKDPFFGLKGPTGDIYLYAHTQFDIQGSYRLAKGFSLQVSGLNLSNEVFGFYQGSKIYPIQREYYKPTVSFGFRWNSSAE